MAAGACNSAATPAPPEVSLELLLRIGFRPHSDFHLNDELTIKKLPGPG